MAISCSQAEDKVCDDLQPLQSGTSFADVNLASQRWPWRLFLSTTLHSDIHHAAAAEQRSKRPAPTRRPAAGQ